MKGYIYELFCPISGLPIYVGSTFLTLKRRLTSHASPNKKSNAPIAKYVRGLNIRPIIILLEEVDVALGTRLRRIEDTWIEKFIDKGFPLLNVKGNKTTYLKNKSTK